MGKILLGIILGFILAPFVVLAYLEFGKVPVAVADPPFPHEKLITQVPLNARIEREKIGTPPIPVNEANLIAGAQVYRDECATCHGYHGTPSKIGPHIYPNAPPLWEKHHDGDVVGVSDDPPGETYWKVSEGIRLTGMPEYKHILSDTQMWQVSLLLANANKPLPPAALEILRGKAAAAPAAPVAPAAPAPAAPAPATKKQKGEGSTA
jgi:mono/diheme cytochrome c family protein